MQLRCKKINYPTGGPGLLADVGSFLKPLTKFEDLLTEKGIVIPSDDRTGDPDEAHLFGTEYSRLEEAIVAIILSES